MKKNRISLIRDLDCCIKKCNKGGKNSNKKERKPLNSSATEKQMKRLVYARGMKR